MAIENFKEVEKYFEDNKDNKDILKYVKGLQLDPLANLKTKEDATQFILKNDLLKQAQESYKDARVTDGIKSYKENNFDKDYQEKYDKEHPPENETQKELREIKVTLAENDKKTARNDMRVLAISKGTELKFSNKAMGLLDNFLGADKAATISNIDNFAAVMDEVSQNVKEQILKEHGIKPEEGDRHEETDLYTKEQLETMTPEDQAKNWDKVQKSMQQL